MPEPEPDYGFIPTPEILGTPIPLVWRDIALTQITDVVGIPHRSDRAPLGLQLDIDWRKRPWTDPTSPSRMQADTPEDERVLMSELEEERLDANFRRILLMTVYIRNGYIESRQDAGDDINPSSLDTASNLTILEALKVLPFYLVYRKNNPIAPLGQIPTSLVVLSNGATGAIGGLAHLIINLSKDEQKKVLNEPPDIDKALYMTEKAGTLVKSTVCVATRFQQRMFLSVVRDGWPRAQQNPTPPELADLLPPDEIPRLIDFAVFMSILSVGLVRFQRFDRKITEDIANSEDPAEQTDLFKQFFEESERVLAEINRIHPWMNAALGRLPLAPEFGLGNLWEEYRTSTQDILEIE